MTPRYHLTTGYVAQQKFDCPTCGAGPGQRCVRVARGRQRPGPRGAPIGRTHPARMTEARKAGY